MLRTRKITLRPNGTFWVWRHWKKEAEKNRARSHSLWMSEFISKRYLFDRVECLRGILMFMMIGFPSRRHHDFGNFGRTNSDIWFENCSSWVPRNYRITPFLAVKLKTQLNDFMSKEDASSISFNADASRVNPHHGFFWLLESSCATDRTAEPIVKYEFFIQTKNVVKI